jgi:hypothetical protein
LVSNVPEGVEEPVVEEPDENKLERWKSKRPEYLERIIKRKTIKPEIEKSIEEVPEVPGISDVNIEDLYKQVYEEGGVKEKTIPAEEELRTILVRHPRKKNRTIEVGEGTSIRNLSIAETIPPGRPGRTEKSTGRIEEILPDGTIKVKTGKGNEEIWFSEDELELDLRELPKFRTSNRRI